MVKEELLNEFDVSILDESVEGTLWLKFTHKQNHLSFLTCVCYLVPAHLSYQVNASDFFDNLLCQISQYQQIGSFYICGDFKLKFNARCGDATDFIEGVDNLSIKTDNFLQFDLSRALHFSARVFG